MSITRRAWLQALSTLPLLSWLPGCGEERPVVSESIDEAALTALVDAIVPADQDPGAVDAGIHVQILEIARADNRQHALYSKGLAMFDAVAQERHGMKFSKLDLEQRVELLTSMVRGMRKEYADGRRCFITARNAVLTRFYSSPEGWRVLDYTPPNDGYD